MIINKISQIHNYGVFRDFTWPKDLPEFGRYNLIYGWNGTGKTTLSRILRCLEKKTELEGEVKIEVDGNEIQDAEFPKNQISVRVFNRDFINETVFPVHSEILPPIFILGEQSVEKQKQVEILRWEHAEAQERLNSAKSEESKAREKMENLCINRARSIKDILRSSGQNPYNNYDKSYFKSDAERMLADNTAIQRLDDEEREKLLAQHRSTPKPKVQEIGYRLPDCKEIVEQLSELLKTTVVSTAINTLKDDPKLAQWTREGLGLHRDRRADKCLFCEQPLPKDRLEALEAHFNTQYEQFMHKLERSIADLKDFLREASNVRWPNKAELYDDLIQEYEVAEEELNHTLAAIRNFLEQTINALEEKKQRAFESVKIDFQLPNVDSKAVEKLNTVICKHNQACDNFQIRVNEARKRLADNMIVESIEDFKNQRDSIQHAKVKLQKVTEEVERLENEITKLEREIIEHRQPAEELNEELNKYLGHKELKLEVKDTGYTIIRDGQPVKALSEGEMTAIALLYFLKSLKDKDFNLAKGIVVLDDPVSSLDANALYLAFGFIRERTQGAEQLIILTHNFTFFRQVRNWFHYLKGQDKKDINQRPAHFYMLECVDQDNKRCSVIKMLDPLLEKYESEYHYIFVRIYRAVMEKKAISLEQNYVLPNMARRLLETFLAFRQPQSSGELWQKVKSLSFDDVKKSRILRFLHTYSHYDQIGEPEHDLSVLSEAQTILKDLLDLIKSEDEKHYLAMESLVNKGIHNESKEPSDE